MANKLDELNYDESSLFETGLDTHVIHTRIKVEKRIGDEIFLWVIRCSGFILSLIGLILTLFSFPNSDWGFGVLLILLGLLPSVCLWIIMNTETSYFDGLEQDINRAASEVDTYILERVELMKSLVRTVNAGLEHELHMMLGSAEARSQGDPDLKRVYIANSLTNIMAQVEAYPETRSNEYILELMRQDSRCVAEVTAARVLYNDRVAIWNRQIFQWPIKRIVASHNGYTTRIPLSAPRVIKEENREAFFT